MRRLPWGRILLSVFAVAVLLAGAALLAPEIDASAAREPLAKALREITGRPVEVGEVHYQVFPMPGISALNVVIPEDPRFGIEPVAYIGELQAGLHWPSLLSGRVRLGSVRLVDASINVARAQDIGWNVAELLKNTLARRKDSPAPKLEVQGGRINFRESTLKSPFFLNQVDLELDPPAADGGRLAWSYAASPARTDRPESGFGRFTGKGAWIPDENSDGRLEVDIELERSLASEVFTLVAGRDLGVQGRISTRANLDGPVAQVRIKGSLRIENSGPQPMFGFSGEAAALQYEGRLNLLSQEVSVSTASSPGGEQLPLELKVLCRRILSQPQWSVSFGFNGMEAPVLTDLFRRFGARAPEGLDVKGVVDGLIEYTQGEPVTGRVTLRGASVSLNEAGPLTFEEATVTLNGPEMTLEPAAMTTPGGDDVELSGRWELETETTEFRLKTPSIALASLKAAIDQLQNVPRIEALESCGEGTLRGELRFERRPSRPESPAAWLGEIELQSAVCAVTGAPDLRVERAIVALNGPRWTARKAAGTWSAWKFTGELEHSPAAGRPYRVEVSLPEVNGEELDAFFQPALRRPMTFIERTFRTRGSVPRWLGARHVAGLAKIERLTLAGETAQDVRLHFYWDGPVIDIPDAVAALDGGRFTGRWNILLGGDRPVSRLKGRVEAMPIGEALIDSEFEASWPGFQPQLVDGLSLEGEVTARSLDFGDPPLRSIHACVDLDPKRGKERLQISCLEAFSPGEFYTGTAAREDSRWVFDFSGPRRQFRLSGTFSPMQFDLEPRPKESSR